MGMQLALSIINEHAAAEVVGAWIAVCVVLGFLIIRYLLDDDEDDDDNDKTMRYA